MHRDRAASPLARSPIPARSALILVAADLVAAAALARSFSGPGMLVPVLSAVLAVPFIMGLALVGARWMERRGASPGRLYELAAAALAAALAAAVPIWWAFGSTTVVGVPTATTFHRLAIALDRASVAFKVLRAPVPELTGLVVAVSFIAGTTALLSVLAVSWHRGGRVWAVLPSVALFCFASSLGAPDGRTLDLAAEVAVVIWYLVAAAPKAVSHDARRVVAEPLTSHAEDVSGVAGARRATAGFVAAATLAAVVVGPLLPGAGTTALVHLHERSAPAQVDLLGTVSGVEAVAGSSSRTGPGGSIAESLLVQVAETKLGSDARTVLFRVHSERPSYWLTTTLSGFNGDVWYATQPEEPIQLPPVPPGSVPFAAPLPGIAAELVTDRFSVVHLGGNRPPAPSGTVAASSSALGLDYDAAGGGLLSSGSLRRGISYTVEATIPEPQRAEELGELPSSVAIAPAAVDLSLPKAVPSVLVTLAHQIVAGATTPYDKALALQRYFTSGAFTYQLPTVGAGDTIVTGGEGLSDLVTFLTETRTGYCQQFASAFAVLARLDGLPSRVAVGFLPGVEHSPDVFTVTGAQAHAWPQVFLGTIGWVSFEPTPGRSGLSGSVSALGTAPPSQGSTSTGPAPRAPNFGRLPASTGSSAHGGAAHKIAFAAGGRAQGSAPALPRPTGPGRGVPRSLELVIGLAVLAAAVLSSAPLQRWWIRHRHSPRHDGSAGVGALMIAWAELESVLAALGLAQQPAETWLEYAQRATRASSLPAPVAAGLGRLAITLSRASFDARPLTDVELGSAVSSAVALRRDALRLLGVVQRLKWWFDPRGPQRLVAVVRPLSVQLGKGSAAASVALAKQ